MIPADKREEVHKRLYELITKLWLRARINAFAHREVMNESRKKESGWYITTILSSLVSMLGITLTYITKDSLSLFFTIISIIFAFVSLFATILSNHKRYGIISEQHEFILNSYMHIAQRTRLAKDPTISTEDLKALYEDLEKDFADIKSRGIEPQDKHFIKAHEIEREREENIISVDAQSFAIKKISKSEKVPDTVSGK